MPFPKIPEGAAWLQWVSPCKYTLQALSIIQFEGSSVELLLDQAALNRPPTVSANLGVLALMFAALAVGSIWVLSMQREVR